jgi:hypothetical protein
MGRNIAIREAEAQYMAKKHNHATSKWRLEGSKKRTRNIRELTLDTRSEQK